MASPAIIPSATLARIAGAILPLLLTALLVFSRAGRPFTLAEKITCTACGGGFALVYFLGDLHLALLSIWPGAMLLVCLLTQPSRKELARRLDDELPLKDVLSTAIQFRAEAAGNSYAEHVLRQAWQSDGVSLAPLAIWRGISRLALLTAVAVATLALVQFLLTAGPREDFPVAALLEQAVLDASDQPDAQVRLRHLADLLNQLEPSLAAAPRQGQSLEELTRAIKAAIESGHVDEATRQKLRSVLAKLEQKRLVAEGGSNPAPPSPDPDRPAKALVPSNEFVAVPAATSASAGGSVDLSGKSTSAPADYDRQFHAAQQEAARLLKEGAIPQEYRQLVRDYYGLKE